MTSGYDIDDYLVDAYNAKVQDLANETLRVSELAGILARVRELSAVWNDPEVTGPEARIYSSILLAVLEERWPTWLIR